MAFTQNVNPTFVRQPNMGLVQITTGTGSSGLVTVYTGGSSNGSKVVGLSATCTTTSAFDIQWGITNTSVFYMLGTVSLPAGSGSTNSIVSVNLMNTTSVPGLTIDSDGNPFFFLRSSLDTLQAKMPATSSTWAAGTVVSLVATVSDF